MRWQFWEKKQNQSDSGYITLVYDASGISWVIHDSLSPSPEPTGEHGKVEPSSCQCAIASGWASVEFELDLATGLPLWEKLYVTGKPFGFSGADE